MWFFYYQITIYSIPFSQFIIILSTVHLVSTEYTSMNIIAISTVTPISISLTFELDPKSVDTQIITSIVISTTSPITDYLLYSQSNYEYHLKEQYNYD